MKDILRNIREMDSEIKKIMASETAKTKTSAFHAGTEIAVLLIAINKITLSCGNTFDMRDYIGKPLVNVPCPCGNPNHWFIKVRMDGDE